jgi:hypothetical protein
MKKFYKNSVDSSNTVRELDPCVDSKLDPNFVTGFAVASGCFPITVSRGVKTWKVIIMFSIHLHIRDLALLEKIQAFFGGIGTIRVNSYKSATFSVAKLDDLVNIPHFKKYPLRGCKAIDFNFGENVSN